MGFFLWKVEEFWLIILIKSFEWHNKIWINISLIGSKYAIDNGEKWMIDNQKTAMGWMDNQNADAMLALRLGIMSKYQPGSCDFNTLSKSLEFDILSALLR